MRIKKFEAVTYDLMAKQGYEGTSMLAVATAAKASNETTYRWYGGKNGLFESMVRPNAEDVCAVWEGMYTASLSPLHALSRVAPVLLGMLLGERAIALNRAAAADASGSFGKALVAGGRETVLPLLRKLMGAAINDGSLVPPRDGDIGVLFMHFLVGDQQIRRVIGTMAITFERQIAKAQFLQLCGVNAGRGL